MATSIFVQKNGNKRVDPATISALEATPGLPYPIRVRIAILKFFQSHPGSVLVPRGSLDRYNPLFTCTVGGQEFVFYPAAY